MKVQLLNYTDHALNLLLFTKNTRLMSEPSGLESVAEWTEERKMEELKYMRGTIQSSWEFITYVFLLTGVSRAFTHQLVRTRTQSYAQQSQRTVDMGDFEFVYPDCTEDEEQVVGQAIDDAEAHYTSLVKHLGAHPQVARSILPTNIATNIMVKTDLRTLSQTARVRLCYRTQGEYQRVFREMRQRVVEVHPWAEPFIRVHCAATGTCAFPNYTECPIQGPVYDPDKGYRSDSNFLKMPNTRDEQQIAWESLGVHEAEPRQMKSE